MGEDKVRRAVGRHEFLEESEKKMTGRDIRRRARESEAESKR